MADLIQEFTASVIAGVDKITSEVVSDMLSNAPTSDTREAISLDQPATLIAAGVVKSKIKIDLDAAPEALAYEFGSGIHGSKGEKYLISPKGNQEGERKEFLAFKWEKAWDTHMFLPDGRVLLRRVWHPGVEAKPYIKPAIEKAMKMLPQLLGRELSDGLDIYFTSSRSG